MSKVNPADLNDALNVICAFTSTGMRKRVQELESAIRGCNGTECLKKSDKEGFTSDLLTAANVVKRAAGQINVVIHAAGILLLLPQILQPDERVERVSIGAGNAGRPFDLETDRRVAEFKFIHWRGGAESIRQNALFKDFYLLAEHRTPKRKELYVLGKVHPLAFLRSGRAIESVLSRHVKLLKAFRAQYRDEFRTVGDYYRARRGSVLLRDAARLLPELARMAAADEQEEEHAALL